MTLTPYQSSQLDRYIKDWKLWMLCTEPANREVAEAAITRCRGYQGHSMRPTFVWSESPLASFKAMLKHIERGKTGRQSMLDECDYEIFHNPNRRHKSAATHKIFENVTDNDTDSEQTICRFSDVCHRMREDHILRGVSNQVLNWISIDLTGEKSLSWDVPGHLWESSNTKIAKNYNYGHLSSARIAHLTFERDVVRKCKFNVGQSEYVDAAANIARSAGLFWNFQNTVFACERPSRLKLDDQGRFHSSEGPAFSYPDGLSLYAIHGVEVQERFITDPESIVPKDIDDERNIEVRRVLLDLYGTERYLRKKGAVVIHEGRDGRKLWWRMGDGGSEPVVMVEVINSTPEPDGHFKRYFIRVPPTMRDADAAIAWTFGLTKEQYFPQKET